MKNFRKIMLSLSVLSSLWASSVSAVELSKHIQFYGYGHAGYLRTDNNTFLKADNNGTWNYNDIALLFVGNVHEKSKVWLQLYHIYDDNRVDWAFVDYTVNNTSTLKLGQIKLPFGLHNDYRDVEYLRLSTLKPFLYQDVSEIVAEAYRGIGYTYQSNFEGLSIDLYAGQIVDFEEGGEDYKELIGARASYNTPMSGLKLMTSIYHSGLEESGESGKIRTLSFSASYHPDKFSQYAQSGHKIYFQGEDCPLSLLTLMKT